MEAHTNCAFWQSQINFDNFPGFRGLDPLCRGNTGACVGRRLSGNGYGKAFRLDPPPMVNASRIGKRVRPVGRVGWTLDSGRGAGSPPAIALVWRSEQIVVAEKRLYRLGAGRARSSKAGRCNGGKAGREPICTQLSGQAGSAANARDRCASLSSAGAPEGGWRHERKMTAAAVGGAAPAGHHADVVEVIEARVVASLKLDVG